MFKKFISTLFICCISLGISRAADVVVKSTGDSGPGTLRDAIAIANAGDRIIIDIRGVLVLNSTITINKPLEIIGPYPIHFNIDLSNIATSTYGFLINTPGIVKIKGVRFETVNGSLGKGAIDANPGSNVEVIDCTFMKCSGANAGAILSQGTFTATNCSFILNTTTLEGGAIRFVNGANARLTNCTFNQNNATSHGGAVRVNGSSLIVLHCTLAENTCGGLGSELSVVNNSTITVANSIFKNAASPNNSLSNTGSGSWSSMGGNFYSINAGSATYIAGGGNAFSQTVSNFSLGPLQTDGYGLMYLLLNPNSLCINGGMMGMTLPTTDCRRAPRILDYSTGTMLPDAGAVEVTKYHVTSPLAAGPGTIGQAIQDINLLGFPPPYYIDFEISPIATINHINYTISKPVIIDGFTQNGSQIGGPGAVWGEFTPPVYPVIFDGFSNIATCLFDFSAGSDNSKMSGIKCIRSTVGIKTNNTSDLFLFGNSFIDHSQTGLQLNNCGNIVVGDSAYHQTNIISENNNSGIDATNCINLKIMNNIIGPSPTGMTVSTSQNIGINIFGASSSNILVGGSSKNKQGNLISANNNAQVSLGLNTGSVSIQGNRIGTNYTSNLAIGNTSIGIVFVSNVTNSSIGGGLPEFGNIIVGHTNAGIQIINSNFNFIFNNWIGVSNIPSPIIIPNNIGIMISGNNNRIGDINGRNFISGNSIGGIIIGGNFNSLENNFFGVDDLNSPLIGNSGANIIVTGRNNAIGTPNKGNVVSNANGHGIYFSNALGNNTVQNNLIGCDSTGINNYGNKGDGIFIENTDSTNIIGNRIVFNGDGVIGKHGINCIGNKNIYANNLIGVNSAFTAAGNFEHGILVNGSNNIIGGTNAQSNILAFNGGDGVNVFGTNSDTNSIMYNTFFNNSGLGIDLEGVDGVDINDPTDADTGPNNLINFPVLSGVTNCNGTLRLKGTFFATTTGLNYTIDFYHVPAIDVDPSGHGEGNFYLGSIVVTPSTTGTNSFTFSLGSSPPMGDFITCKITLEYASGKGETSEFSTAYEIAPTPVFSVIGTDITCNNQNDGTVTINTLVGTGPFTYTWFDGTGVLPGQTTSSISGLSAETYFATITDSAGCSINSPTYTVFNPSAITGNITTTTATCNSTCDGSLTFSASGGTSPLQYSLDNGITFQSSSTFSGLCGGVYGSLIIQDNNGCQLNLGNGTVSAPSAISVSTTTNNESCKDFCNGSVAISASGGITPHTFSIDGSTFSGTSTFSGLCRGNYTAYVIDASGCSATSTFSIITTDSVNASFTFTPACVGAPVNYTSTSTISSGTINSWNWTFNSGNPNSSTAQNPTSIIYTAPGNFTTQLVVGNATCWDTVALVVNVNNSPIIDAGPNDTICFGSSYTQSLTISSGVTPFTFNWQPSSHFTSNTVQNPSLVSSLSTGTYNHVVTVTDANQCVAKDSMLLSIILPPDPSFNYANSTFCPIGIANASINGTTGGLFSAVPSGLSINTSTGNIDLANSTSNTYTITYSVNNGTCSRDSSVMLTILPNDDPNVIYNNNASDTVRFCNSGPNPTPTFIATPGGGFSSPTLSVLNNGEIIMSSATVGQHEIIYSTANCGNKDTIHVFITGQPNTPSTTQVNFTYCQGQSINPITINPPGNGEIINWYSNANLTNLISNAGVFTPPSTVGTTLYYVTLSLANCESNPLVISVTVVNSSLINAGSQQSICENQTVQLGVSGLTAPVDWSPGIYLSDSTILNPVASPPNSMYFFVSGSISGCPVSDSVFVDVNLSIDCEFQINNAFSPDGDGINDTWIIDAAYNNTNNTVIIYNRWGNELITFKNYDNVNVVWDGKYKGNLLPGGTYYYVIIYHENNRKFAGWVQLMH